jgi:crotonobetainyl-CoA:carnitine CoA-transferase CaiB-like acyl-CoA transferase
MRSPLADVLIVDLSRHLPGPYASRMLANLGARIVKVEEPEFGDPVRAAPPFRSGRSRLAASLLGGVESIALDLRKKGGVAVLGSLLARADVLIESFRPGKLASFGFEPKRLRTRFPRLVICSLSGWGQEGPWAARSGHDLTYQAAAGALVSGDRAPSLPSADMLGAWSAVAAVTAALFDREKSGEGVWIDASLFDAAMTGNVTNIAESMGCENRRRESSASGALTGAIPCYRLYEARDRRLIALAALESGFWSTFCEAVGRRDLVRLQYRRDAASHRRVAELMAERTAEEWRRLFLEHDLPGEIVASPAEALGGEQARARGLGAVDLGSLPYPALLDESRPLAESSFPRVGEHTRAILAEFCPRWVARSRRERIAVGIGPRLSVRRSVRGWVGRFRG